MAVLSSNTYPLGFILLPSFGDSDRIGEYSIVLPELQLRERRSTSEEVQHGGNNGPLVTAELNARRSLNVSALELQLAGVG